MQISDAEMEVMEIIWSSNNPITSNEIFEKFPEGKWKLTTILTLASRLIEKGVLMSEKIGRNHHYRPVISKSEYKRMRTKGFLKEFHQGSIKNFFAALYCEGEISDEDLNELKDLLDKRGE